MKHSRWILIIIALLPTPAAPADCVQHNGNVCLSLHRQENNKTTTKQVLQHAIGNETASKRQR